MAVALGIFEGTADFTCPERTWQAPAVRTPTVPVLYILFRFQEAYTSSFKDQHGLYDLVFDIGNKELARSFKYVM